MVRFTRSEYDSTRRFDLATYLVWNRLAMKTMVQNKKGLDCLIVCTGIVVSIIGMWGWKDA